MFLLALGYLNTCNLKPVHFLKCRVFFTFNDGKLNSWSFCAVHECCLNITSPSLNLNFLYQSRKLCPRWKNSIHMLVTGSKSPLWYWCVCVVRTQDWCLGWCWRSSALFDLAEELNEVIFVSDMTLFIFFFWKKNRKLLQTSGRCK